MKDRNLSTPFIGSRIHRKLNNVDVTPFARAVYQYTLTIPKGQTRTYAQVAQAIGRPRAMRAVGNTLNRNPFAPLVPCHRVVRSDGTLGGFASGPAKKRALLNAERALNRR